MSAVVPVGILSCQQADGPCPCVRHVLDMTQYASAPRELPRLSANLFARHTQKAVVPDQVGDVVWSMLPGAPALTPTRITDVRHVIRTGYASVHTLQGQ